MSAPAIAVASSPIRGKAALSALLALYVLATILSAFPNFVAPPVLTAMHILLAAAFALVHGWLLYGSRGIFQFTVICLAVCYVIENVGVITGFPYGHYYFSEQMGPRILHVPVMLGPAYLGMGYVSWTLGRVIQDDTQGALKRSNIFTVPLVASFLMVAWDATIDPVFSTIGHFWVWTRGGSYFGVPLMNFFGWFVTVYVMYQLFAVYLSRRSASDNLASDNSLPDSYWRIAVIFYGISTAGAVLRALTVTQNSEVLDPTEVHWKVRDIYGVCALVGLLTMGAFTTIAAAKLANLKNPQKQPNI
jgi:putative membrane protein